jgi:uncharacterized membrane protein YfcA
MTATLVELLLGLLAGISGGVSSGLLGVSPGGALTVFSALLMGAEQHVAQGLSLIAQIPPTGLAGLRRYREAGGEIPRRWLAPLILGFVAGGFAGAAAAASVSAAALRWTYVAYLVALDALLILRKPRREEYDPLRQKDASLAWPALFAVGGLAGVSSGFLGIGGGLAIVVGLGPGLGVPQRRPQMVALALTLLPMTAPAAYVYWRAGWAAPWPSRIGGVLGLWAGTSLGTRAAQSVSETALRRLVVGFVAAMALAMTAKALALRTPYSAAIFAAPAAFNA